MRPTSLLLIFALAGTAGADLQGQIAFSTNRHVCIMNADGSGLRQLARGTGPAWSPDGARLAFVGGSSGISGDGNLSIMDRDGSNVQVLLEEDGFDVGEPSFSHDGGKVLFSLHRDTESSIYEIDVNGGVPRQIPLFPSNPDDPTLLYDPAPAPDGLTLAFVLARPSQFGTRSLGHLYLADMDGSNRRLIGGEIGHHSRPAWSPAGDLAFYSKRDDGEGIYVADQRGANQRLLSVDWVIDWDPAWSPDGEWIAFASSQSRKGIDIFVMRRDGTEVTNLTNTPEIADHAPAWSPVPLPRLETPILQPTWGQFKADRTAE